MHNGDDLKEGKKRERERDRSYNIIIIITIIIGERKSDLNGSLCQEEQESSP